jgi:hypothetical protein
MLRIEVAHTFDVSVAEAECSSSDPLTRLRITIGRRRLYRRRPVRRQ